MYLRPYKDKDLDALYALDLVCFEPRFRFSRSMMRQLVLAPRAVVRLACEFAGVEGEVLTGFVLASVERVGTSLLGYVSTLDVAPEQRGQGIGRLLMHAAEEVVAQGGVEWMDLHVSVGNGAAKRLYERLGYIQIAREPSFYGVGYDAWLYRKQLLTTPSSTPES